MFKYVVIPSAPGRHQVSYTQVHQLDYQQHCDHKVDIIVHFVYDLTGSV